MECVALRETLPESIDDLRQRLSQIRETLVALQARTADDARAKARLSFLLVSCRHAMDRLNEASPRNLAKAVNDVDEMVSRATAFCRALESRAT